jgi:hypothetical protein
MELKNTVTYFMLLSRIREKGLSEPVRGLPNTKQDVSHSTPTSGNGITIPN